MKRRTALALGLTSLAVIVGCIALLAMAPGTATPEDEAPVADARSSPAQPSARLANVKAEEVRRDLQPLLARLSNGDLYPGLPNPKITHCEDSDTLCQMDQLMFLREWKAAHEGDYAAQRNVAFCFRGSSTCGVVPDQIQGCAWRVIIIDAADPEMHEGDASNFELECGQLTQAGRIAADVQASRIKGLIGQASRKS